MGAGSELVGLRKDGSEVHIEIGLNPIETAEGMFVLGSIVEVTAQRARDGKRDWARKLESVGALAHDFNNSSGLLAKPYTQRELATEVELLLGPP